MARTISFVTLKAGLKSKIAVVEKLPKSVKRDNALKKLKAMQKLLPCPPQLMTVDL
jgi:hypothetical protein